MCYSGSKKLNSLLNDKKEDVETTVKAELAAGRRITIAMDGWSKKGLTASFLAVSASFYSTSVFHLWRPLC